MLDVASDTSWMLHRIHVGCCIGYILDVACSGRAAAAPIARPRGARTHTTLPAACMYAALHGDLAVHASPSRSRRPAHTAACASSWSLRPRSLQYLCSAKWDRPSGIGQVGSAKWDRLSGIARARCRTCAVPRGIGQVGSAKWDRLSGIARACCSACAAQCGAARHRVPRR